LKKQKVGEIFQKVMVIFQSLSNFKIIDSFGQEFYVFSLEFYG